MKYSLKQINDPSLPVSLNNFLNYLRTIRAKSERTIYNYKIDLILFFRFLKLYRGLSKDADFEDIVINDIDSSFLDSITLEDLFAFLSFTEEFRNNGSYARARKIAALRSFFKYISGKAKIIKENPTLELESPSLPKRNPIYLTLEESQALLNSIDGPFKERDYCIITLFLNCGLRLSELVSIDISKIKGDTLTILGKGNKERTIYLNEMCLKAIEDYIPVRNQKASSIKIEDKDALFISRKLTRINQRTIELMVKKYALKANLDYEKLTPHKLRHTAATLMYKYGNVDIRSLQQILGHESVSTTQIYTHIDDENLRKAVKSNPLNNVK
ncbi:site-specific recombinase XerD [Clostridium acetobutylicum]|uniref:tyrosine recombinase XerC n=1 Tax=Clostridium TaxID=1485 RepID=UPI000200A6A7|nr:MULTISPECIES: tyrosine recombinase XerC [Clostridium]ADZ20880.1 site-specific recombinase, phage integrase family [Clostridium acetobutylicum EA 2018]AEI31986.1 site-specific recombinase, phage integrase [Clostridium acetobutylicum DSM 1731]AWV79771.1 tyrosine recombinase XerC [Clostridium acetobutylicum]MBC2394247.1 tyrosine recombinase XerC [Clostridium acetobutylicum]MBC2584697.1 tyrosine recombinase XerC [Clostridium acetobutylicum]